MDFRTKLKKLGRRFRHFFAVSPKISGAIFYYFYRTICSSLRFKQTPYAIGAKFKAFPTHEIDKNSAREPQIFCLWHDEFFPVMHVTKNVNIAAVVSASSDGAILENLLHRLGLITVSGSSHKGGVRVLLQLARVLKENKGNVHACITVDGPRGPRHQAKEGAFFLAYRLQCPIVPVRVRMHNVIRFPTWDKFQFPLPFSRVEIIFGDPFYVTEELTAENLKNYRTKFENALNSLAPKQ